jgi:tetratricopeptide (TPR) repeat protein
MRMSPTTLTPALLAGTTLLATMLAFAPLATGAQQGNPQAAEHVNNAIQALSGSSPDPERALSEVEEALEIDPENAQAYFYRGMAHGQLQQLQQALDAFVTAGDLSPGYTDAHVWATRLAGQFQNWELAWEQAILASQSGFDMSQAFAEMRQVSEPPEDFEQRLRAPRVLLGGIDVEAVTGQDAFLNEDEELFGSTLGGGAAGESKLAEAQADILEVRRTFGILLQESHDFAVVQNAELANYVLTLKINDIGNARPRFMEGIVKLMDGDEEVYSRPIRLRDIASTADLRTDIHRQIAFMEEWLAEQER